MNFKLLLILLIFRLGSVICSPIDRDDNKVIRSETVITADNSTTGKSQIKFGILNKQHHLYIGRCKPGDKKFHGENIILNNDDETKVDAVITINIEGNVSITCVNILDQIPNGEGGYPSYINGGVGYNFIKFSITTEIGKGFNFYVEIYGYHL